MKPSALLLLLLALLLVTPLRADVIHLTNGRTLEGQVVARTGSSVHLEVPGGRLVLPRAVIRKVELKRTAQEEYAARARRTDMSDPEAVEALALWASGRGLGDQARHLDAMASGLRLQQRVDRIRASKSGDDWVELYHWCRQLGYSNEVQRWVVERALEVAPGHGGARKLLREIERRAEEARERERRARERTRHREDRRRGAEKRRQTQQEQVRLKALESRLAREQEEARALREQVTRLERETEQKRLRRLRWLRIRRRRHRGRGGIVVTTGRPAAEILTPGVAHPAHPQGCRCARCGHKRRR